VQHDKKVEKMYPPPPPKNKIKDHARYTTKRQTQEGDYNGDETRRRIQLLRRKKRREKKKATACTFYFKICTVKKHSYR
jgi:hypothetical protein